MVDRWSVLLLISRGLCERQRAQLRDRVGVR